MCVGVWILRHRRRRVAIPASSLQAWNMTVVLYLASCVILLVVPWFAFSLVLEFFFTLLTKVSSAGYRQNPATLMCPSGMRRTLSRYLLVMELLSCSSSRYCVAGIGLLLVRFSRQKLTSAETICLGLRALLLALDYRPSKIWRLRDRRRNRRFS